MISLAIDFLGALYIIAALAIAFFAGQGIVTLVAYWRHRSTGHTRPLVPREMLPRVTVQLPIYNERLVARRLIDAAVALNYPVDRLEIQVLDDSVDETTAICSEAVEYYRRQGFDIKLLHRRNRVDYKAGALHNATKQALGTFVAVFDADFIPPPDFLLHTVPYFLTDSRLGMIQTRWGHLNSSESVLTAAQAIALDKHFTMEQSARHNANLFPKFNGSGGIWRIQCVLEVGGWQGDTLCEDLCLSTRAVLNGWRTCFLNDVVAPAELPSTMSAFKNQQSRWATGSTQCLMKFGADILSSKHNTLLSRIYALVSMAGYLTFPFILLLLLVQVPLSALDYEPPSGLLGLAVAGLGQPLLFVLGQKLLYRDWAIRLRHLPVLLIIGIGLAPVYSRAISRGLSGRSLAFVRTPKSGHQARSFDLARGRAPLYKLHSDWIVIAEMALAIYALAGIIICILSQNPGAIPFLATCALGLGYVAYSTIVEER